jgi:hypothetical protein
MLKIKKEICELLNRGATMAKIAAIAFLSLTLSAGSFDHRSQAAGDPVLELADYGGGRCLEGPTSQMCNCLDQCFAGSLQCQRSWTNKTPLIDAFNIAAGCITKLQSCVNRCNPHQ